MALHFDPATYHMMHSSHITFSQRAAALKYRTGTVYTAKQRFRFGYAVSDRCILCGQPDGGHHMAAACQSLSKMYTCRHHQAGRLIMNAVLAGDRGNEVVMMDVGKLNMDEGPASMPHRIPLHTLPSCMSDEAKRAAASCSIPDGFMYKAATTQTMETYTVLEIKFCRDTDPTGQLARARTQHSRLVEALTAAAPGAVVQMEVILIGVSGAIYTEHTKDPMVRLGVTRGAWDKLKYRLNVLAVQQLHWIHVNKLIQESAMQPGVHGTKRFVLKKGRCVCLGGQIRKANVNAPQHRKRKSS